METITTYLCCKKMVAFEDNYFDPDIISVVSGKVSTKIIKKSAECSPDAVKLTTKMIGVGVSRYCKLFNTGVISVVEDRQAIRNLKITYSHSDHCQWAASVLWVNGSNRTLYPQIFPRNLIQISFPIGGGACPDSKADVFGGGGESEVNVKAYWDDGDPESSSQDIIPGDGLNVSWYFSDGINEERVFAAQQYFSTDNLTGGLITAVNGEYGSEDITYTVNIEGESIICVSSDFVEYAVGDWVTVQSSGNVILPLKIGSFTN